MYCMVRLAAGLLVFVLRFCDLIFVWGVVSVFALFRLLEVLVSCVRPVVCFVV